MIRSKLKEERRKMEYPDVCGGSDSESDTFLTDEKPRDNEHATATANEDVVDPRKVNSYGLGCEWSLMLTSQVVCVSTFAFFFRGDEERRGARSR